MDKLNLQSQEDRKETYSESCCGRLNMSNLSTLDMMTSSARLVYVVYMLLKCGYIICHRNYDLNSFHIVQNKRALQRLSSRRFFFITFFDLIVSLPGKDVLFVWSINFQLAGVEMFYLVKKKLKITQTTGTLTD